MKDDQSKYILLDYELVKAAIGANPPEHLQHSRRIKGTVLLSTKDLPADACDGLWWRRDPAAVSGVHLHRHKLPIGNSQLPEILMMSSDSMSKPRWGNASSYDTSVSVQQPIYTRLLIY